jgi:hypothetical protein
MEGIWSTLTRSNACSSAFRLDGRRKPTKSNRRCRKWMLSIGSGILKDAGTILPLGITYQTIDRQPRKTTGVLYIDEHMSYTLTAEGIFWLYRSEESEKVRHLGG